MDALPGRMAAVAGRQHALITSTQLTDLEVTRHQRAHLLATGRIRRVGRGVYLLNGAAFTWRTRIAAAWLGMGSGAVVSHRSAAALYALDGFDQQRVVHLSVSGDRSPRATPDVRVHRCSDFGLIRPQTVDDILVTDPARLVLDLYAIERNLEVARRALFSARKKKLVTWTGLGECLERHARQGRRGVGRLRADLELYGGTGCPETSFEEAIRHRLVTAGLPAPELQHWVTTAGGRYRIDVAYPEFRVGIEGKSRAHHLTDEAFERDPVRDADLGIAGWIIIHVTWAQLATDPAGVVHRIRRALRSRGMLLSA